MAQPPASTELLAARAELARVQQLARQQARILASLSHDLRTPLNAILGWTTLLRTGRLDAPTTQRALETLERSVRAQQRLLDDLSDAARVLADPEQQELGEFDRPA